VQAVLSVKRSNSVLATHSTFGVVEAQPVNTNIVINIEKHFILRPCYLI
jgi:hypothetical protein